MESQERSDLRDIEREQRRREAEDDELFAMLTWLIKQKAWEVYVAKVLNPRIENMGQAVLAPSKGIEGVLLAEYQKGAMSGLILARDLPNVIVQLGREKHASEDEEWVAC